MKNSSLFRLKSDTKRVRECDALARAQVIKRNTARFQRRFLPSFLSLSLCVCVCVCLSLSFSEKSLFYVFKNDMSLFRVFRLKILQKKRRRKEDKEEDKALILRRQARTNTTR